MRMSVQPSAVDRLGLTPLFGWGSMATTRAGDLAYLTVRPATAAPDGTKRYEVGVIAHGPAGDDLAQHVCEEVIDWNDNYRDRAVRFELPDTAEMSVPAAGRYVLERPHHPITVIWE